MIVNRANLNLLNTGFKTIFQNAFMGAASAYERVAMVVPSSTAKETYAWLGQTTGFREWLGDRQLQALKSYDYTIRNKDFENTVRVDRNTIEDDQYQVYNPIISQLGQDARQHPDSLVFALLKDGWTTNGYDGVPFFSASHPRISGDGETTWSNNGGGASTPWFLLDASRMVKPVIFQRRKDYQFTAMDSPTDEATFMRKEFRYGVDARVNVGFGLPQLAYGSKDTLNAANYATARAAMSSLLGDNGKPLGVIPTLLVVPPTLESAALQIINADYDAAGASNVWKGTAQLLVTPWLA